MTPITAGPCIRFGLETFTRRPGILVGALVLWGLASMLLEVPGYLADDAGTGPLEVVLGIAGFLASNLLTLGSYAFYLRAHDDIDAVGLSDLWHPTGFWRFLGATWLVLVTTALLCVAAAGVPLLILPDEASLQVPLILVTVGGALTFAIRFIFAPLLVVNRPIGPFEAMKESARLLNGRIVAMSWLLFLLFGINLLGLLCLVFGLLATIPIATLAYIHAFRLAEAAAELPAVPTLAAEPV